MRPPHFPTRTGGLGGLELEDHIRWRNRGTPRLQLPTNFGEPPVFSITLIGIPPHPHPKAPKKVFLPLPVRMFPIQGSQKSEKNPCRGSIFFGGGGETPTTFFSWAGQRHRWELPPTTPPWTSCAGSTSRCASTSTAPTALPLTANPTVAHRPPTTSSHSYPNRALQLRSGANGLWVCAAKYTQ